MIGPNGSRTVPVPFRCLRPRGGTDGGIVVPLNLGVKDACLCKVSCAHSACSGPEADIAMRRCVGDKGEGDAKVPESNRFIGVFRHLIIDEGHMAKNPRTRIHRAIAAVQANYCWIVTATLFINRKEDILGLLKILWRDEWGAATGDGT